MHWGIVFGCNQCEHKAKTKSHLNVHMQSQHEVYRFYCDQCNYTAATKGKMNVHKQAKHEGIQYSCDEGVIQLDCDQCEYKETQKISVRMQFG